MNFNSWEEFKEGLGPVYNDILNGLISFGKGIAILLIGWLIARLVRKVLTKVLTTIKLDNVVVKFEMDDLIRKLGIKNGLAVFLGKLAYWIVMLFVIMGASQAANLSLIYQKIESFLGFLPALFSALLIFIVGMVIANKIKTIITNVTSSLGSSAGRILANIVYYFIMVMLTITALDQLGIDTSLISNNLIIFVAILMFSGTIAYGIAAKDVMANMLASFFGKKNFSVGQRVIIDGVEGQIIKIDNITVTIQTSSHKVVIPSRILLSQKVEIIED